MCTVLSLSEGSPVASITTRAHQPMWDEWYRLAQCHRKLGGDGWQIHSSREETYFGKRGASPRPLKQGQTSKGGHEGAVPAMEKFHSVTSCACNQLLPPLCRAFSVCHECQLPEGWTLCTKYQEATLHKNEQILSSLQRRRFTGESTSNLWSETRSR